MKIKHLLLFVSATLYASASLRTLQRPWDGGRFTIALPEYPAAVLNYLGDDQYSESVNALVLESLAVHDLQSYEYIPLLATRWSISKDKKTFTFTLNPKAHFSDGVPVTSEDVKFTFDKVTSAQSLTIPTQSQLASIASCEILGKHTVLFRAKTLHFANFEKVATLLILPKHIYSRGNFNTDFNQTLIGSGPYSLSALKLSEKLVLQKNNTYWNPARAQKLFHFNEIVFKAVTDPAVALELFKRGEFDYFHFISSKMWERDTTGPAFEKQLVSKLKVESLVPPNLHGICWNLRLPLFQDRRVRLALSHLMNREQWMKDLFYNNYIPSAGPFAIRTPFHSPEVIPIPYNPGKAVALLAEAGWNQVGSDGVLIREDQLREVQRFEFSILSGRGSERHLSLYQEELRKRGIKMNLRLVDWATDLKLKNAREFEARETSRGRGTLPFELGEEWSSETASIPGSRNLCGYANSQVDGWIRQFEESFDPTRRKKLAQKIEKQIAYDQPFSFGWEPAFVRIGLSNRIAFSGKGYFPYSSWQNAFYGWWIDPKKDRVAGAALP